MKFIEKLQFLMGQKGITQAKLAREMGLTDGSITGWMNGSRPRKGAFIKLSTFFGVSLSSIMNDDEDLVYISEPKELIERNKQINDLITSGNLDSLIDTFDEIYNIKTSEDKRSFIAAMTMLDDKTLKEIAGVLAYSKHPLDAYLVLHLIDFKNRDTNSQK